MLPCLSGHSQGGKLTLNTKLKHTVMMGREELFGQGDYA